MEGKGGLAPAKYPPLLPLGKEQELDKETKNAYARDLWAKKFAADPEAHRARVRKWRADNSAKARQLGRDSQAARRRTPWGAVNNRMWALMHNGVRAATGRVGKYQVALGYTWADLRNHIESQFRDDMDWGNWGSVWEIDHIRPVSQFKYVSIDDPLFREAWALPNLRPLHRAENASKGAKV